MLQTVLFDLDGTLLGLEQEEFTTQYFRTLVARFAPLGYEPEALFRNVWKGTAAMVKNDGSQTNEAAFWRSFYADYGDRARADRPLFDRFYETEFNALSRFTERSEAALALVRALRAEDVPLVLASNPVFPMTAQRNRMAWAGLDEADFLLVTGYENSHYCKPNPDYYREIVQKLDLDPAQCLMIGNDAREDVAAAELGMRVFLVTDHLYNKDGLSVEGVPHGSWADCEAYIATQK